MAGPQYRDRRDRERERDPERDRDRIRNRDRDRDYDPVQPRRVVHAAYDERDKYYDPHPPTRHRVVEYIDDPAQPMPIPPVKVQYVRDYDSREYDPGMYIPRKAQQEPVKIVYTRAGQAMPNKYYNNGNNNYYNEPYREQHYQEQAYQDPYYNDRDALYHTYYEDYPPNRQKDHPPYHGSRGSMISGFAANSAGAASNGASGASAGSSTHLHSIYMRTVPLDDGGETPMIRRNKEMRQRNQRRSSLGKRGKRLTSIGNGLVAMPHRDIPTKDYYKHLDTDLPEADQMRQLLQWCAKRQLEKSQEEMRQKRDELSANATGDLSGSVSAAASGTNADLNEQLTALNIAKSIQEDLVKDLSAGSISTDWHNRSESAAVVSKNQKPNKQNMAMKENLRLFSQKLKDLEQERSIWLSELVNLREFSKDHFNQLKLRLESLMQQVETAIVEQSTNYSGNSFMESSDLDTVEQQISHLETLLNKLQDASSRIESINRSCSIFISQQQQELTTVIGEQRKTTATATDPRSVCRALSRLLS